MVEKKHQDFGARVTLAMRTAGLTLPELHKRMAPLSYEIVRRYAAGETMPRPDALEKLAKCLGVTSEWLRTGRNLENHEIAFSLLNDALALIQNFLKMHGIEYPVEVQVNAAKDIAKAMSEGKQITVDDINIVFLKMIA